MSLSAIMLAHSSIQASRSGAARKPHGLRIYLSPAIVDELLSDSWYPRAGQSSRCDGIRIVHRGA